MDEQYVHTRLATLHAGTLLLVGLHHISTSRRCRPNRCDKALKREVMVQQSKLLHYEDGAPLNMVLNDAGTLLVVCSLCNHTWTARYAPGSSGAGASAVQSAREAFPRKDFTLDPEMLRDPASEELVEGLDMDRVRDMLTPE